MDKFCLLAILGLTTLIGAIVAMFLNYRAKANKKGIELEKNDQQHNQRIKELEKKNGAEQRQINELKEEIQKLKAK